MTFFDCMADLVGQLNGNGQKGCYRLTHFLSNISGYATATQGRNAASSPQLTFPRNDRPILD